MKSFALSLCLLVTLLFPGYSSLYGQIKTMYVPLTAQLEIEVIIPLGIIKESDLSFGFALPGNGTGYVTILPAENPQRSASGAASLLPTAPGIVSAGKFRITGTPGAQVNTAFSLNPILLFREGGIASMFLNLTRSSSSLQLDSSGEGVFYVGGTVTIWWGQILGHYTGTFNVTVSYN